MQKRRWQSIASGKLGWVAKITTSAILLYIVGKRFITPQTFELLARAEPFFLIPALLLTVFQIGIGSLRWWIFGRALGLKASPYDYLRTHYAAAFAAQVAPTSLVGDALKLTCFKGENSWKKVTFSLVLDKASTHLAWLLPGLLMLSFLNHPTLPLSPIYFLSAGILLFLVLRQPFEPLVKKSLHLLFRDRRTRWHFPLSLLMAVSIPLSFYLCTSALRIHLDLAHLLLFFPFVLLALTIPVSFAGWGLRELVVVGTYSAWVDAKQLVAASLLFGLCGLLAALPGAGFLLLNRRVTSESSPTSAAEWVRGRG